MTMNLDEYDDWCEYMEQKERYDEIRGEQEGDIERDETPVIREKKIEVGGGHIVEEEIKPWKYRDNWVDLGNSLFEMLYLRQFHETGTVDFRYGSGVQHLSYEIQIYGLERSITEGPVYSLSFTPMEMSESGSYQELNDEQKWIVINSRAHWEKYKKEQNEQH
jgi:hypothetical protein